MPTPKNFLDILVYKTKFLVAFLKNNYLYYLWTVTGPLPDYYFLVLKKLQANFISNYILQET